jgi:hypothetical protein
VARNRIALAGEHARPRMEKSRRAATAQGMTAVIPRFEGPITFVQTASGAAYEAMLAATDARHRAYCAANGIEFWSHVGLLRGFHPWQATFNRVDMLAEKLGQDWRGWFVYVDADAVVRQLDFDLRRYLGKRQHHALIAASGGEGDWNINAGVIFLNLEDERGRIIARRWIGAVDRAVSVDMLRAVAEPWGLLPDGRGFPDDQHLLQMVLRDDDALRAGLLIESDPIFNYRAGRFIRQFIRSTGDVENRLEQMQQLMADNP